MDVPLPRRGPGRGGPRQSAWAGAELSTPAAKESGTVGHLARLGLSELVGTALLVGVGLSIVVVDIAPGGPVAAVLPNAFARRALTGVLFGSVGASIALSPVGKVSGAHINPVVSLVFWLEGTMPSPALGVYVLAQCLGAILGAAPLLAWGALGRSVSFGATEPGPPGALAAAGGEAGCTLALVFLLLGFVGSQKLRPFTPAIFPVLYGVLVAIEAPLSGTSTNPARTLGPAVVADVWKGAWVYLVGPVVGALGGLALREAVHRRTHVGQLPIEVAKVFHFEHDPFTSLAHLHHLELDALARGRTLPATAGRQRAARAFIPAAQRALRSPRDRGARPGSAAVHGRDEVERGP